MQAERVRGQRRPQRPRQGVLLQVQEQPARAVPLRLAFLRRLAPVRVESRCQLSQPSPTPRLILTAGPEVPHPPRASRPP